MACLLVGIRSMLGKMRDSIPGRGSRLKRRELGSWEGGTATLRSLVPCHCEPSIFCWVKQSPKQCSLLPTATIHK
jgi:hypothetical protein